MRILIYNENVHEQTSAQVRAIYPDGLHAAIAEAVCAAGDEVSVVSVETVGELTDERLAATDVLLWWGHLAHEQVPDEVAYRVRDAVLGGMGAIFLHSAHKSKPFMTLLGTDAGLCWRESGDREIGWVVDPAHPIARGIDRFFILPAEETYGEPFGIPTPDELVFISSFSGGEVFRSGCVFRRGRGRIFYFQPGHETYPTYADAAVRRILRNAVEYVCPAGRAPVLCPHVRTVDDAAYVT